MLPRWGSRRLGLGCWRDKSPVRLCRYDRRCRMSKVMFAPDWIDLTDEQLAEIARQSFILGLRDGRELSGPISGYRVISALREYTRSEGQWTTSDDSYW